MSKESLVKELVHEGYLKTPGIIKAFLAIDRKDFVPEEIKQFAYLNQALSIGYGQTISQPLTVAFMLELLDLKPGDKILDVGAGSGWAAALLAHIVSKGQGGNDEESQGGKVIAVERIQELKDFAENNIKKYGFIESGSVKVILGDASQEMPDEAPFDKIIAAAVADRIPEAWKSETRVGGRIVAPLNKSIVLLHKISATEFEKKEFFGFSFVPLVINN